MLCCSVEWVSCLCSQSALNMVSRCMAVDMQTDGILCVSIHPGQVRTSMGGAEVIFISVAEL